MQAREVYVLNGARTPFGSFGGALATVSATRLGVVAATAALLRSGVAADAVDNVVFGNVIASDNGAAYIARHIGLDVGLPAAVPALTVNRLCGSGLQAVLTAAKDILCGESEVALVGGAESMSRSPYVLRNARFGLRMGDGVAADVLTEVLTDCRGDMPMGVTAENLAERYGISRAAQDAFALLSQQRAAAARAAGIFAQEIVAVPVAAKGGEMLVTEDEHLRPDTTPEKLAALRPAFRQHGTVTPGNASGINDGAAALVIASGAALARNGWTPLARIVAYGVAGVEPRFMGIGPVPAVNKTLAMAGWGKQDVDLWEINEAFAAQYLSVEQELALPRERTNVNGGAIALGHPVGASGARLLLTLVRSLADRNLRRGVAALCIGGGQGIAIAVERV